jgi:hypothetical protein
MEKVTQKDRREKVERTTFASKRVQRSINYVVSQLERDKTHENIQNQNFLPKMVNKL